MPNYLSWTPKESLSVEEQELLHTNAVLPDNIKYVPLKASSSSLTGFHYFLSGLFGVGLIVISYVLFERWSTLENISLMTMLVMAGVLGVLSAVLFMKGRNAQDNNSDIASGRARRGLFVLPSAMIYCVGERVLRVPKELLTEVEVVRKDHHTKAKELAKYRLKLSWTDLEQQPKNLEIPVTNDVQEVEKSLNQLIQAKS